MWLNRSFKFLLCIFFGCADLVGGQRVYSVKYRAQADICVYVTKYPNQADLLIYKTKYRNQVINDNEGWWFFEDYPNRAHTKIFFEKYPTRADLKIHFVQYKSGAGWRNYHKKHTLY